MRLYRTLIEETIVDVLFVPADRYCFDNPLSWSLVMELLSFRRTIVRSPPLRHSGEKNEPVSSSTDNPQCFAGVAGVNAHLDDVA